MKDGRGGVGGGRPRCEGQACLRAGHLPGDGGRFAQCVDSCIYSIWYDITAYVHLRPQPSQIGCFITGVFLRNCIISTAFSSSHFPYDHHNRHHSHYLFLNQWLFQDLYLVCFGVFPLLLGESGHSQVMAKHGVQTSVLPPDAEVWGGPQRAPRVRPSWNEGPGWLRHWLC